MKGFRKRRPLPPKEAEAVQAVPQMPQGFAARLQQALPAIDLTAQAALLTAFANDVDPDMVFAQQVYGYGRAGDALLALTTSGNSKNVVNAVHAARARGMRTLGITGEGGERPFRPVRRLPAPARAGDGPRCRSTHCPSTTRCAP